MSGARPSIQYKPRGLSKKPVIPERHRNAEVVAYALAQPLACSHTQGQCQIFAQRQQAFKRFIDLHGVSPSSNHGFLTGTSSVKMGSPAAVAFNQIQQLVVANMCCRQLELDYPRLFQLPRADGT
jgi:hypothetical protein